MIALRNVEPKKKKGTLCKSSSRGGCLENRLKWEILNLPKNFLKKITHKAAYQPSKIFQKKLSISNP